MGCEKKVPGESGEQLVDVNKYDSECCATSAVVSRESSIADGQSRFGGPTAEHENPIFH